jgi:hypothetical protein
MAFRPGDLVVFRLSKTSLEPGRRAQNVHPAPHGDTYTYLVDKFWAVSEVVDAEHLVLVTRRGKEHPVAIHDPRLRRAQWWERWLYRDRFPNLQRIRELQEAGRRLAKLRW